MAYRMGLIKVGYNKINISHVLIQTDGTVDLLKFHGISLSAVECLCCCNYFWENESPLWEREWVFWENKSPIYFKGVQDSWILKYG